MIWWKCSRRIPVQLPADLEGKRRILKSLMNIRMP